MGAGTQSKPRALLAEDDEEMRGLVAETLRGAGFDVQEVGDGRQMWIRTIRGAAYDLVVSDLRLPIVDGLTVLEDLRERFPATSIILMTAFGDDAARARAERLHAVFLEKPFRMGELRAAVRRLSNGTMHRGSP